MELDFQRIVEKIEEILPDKWENVVFMAEYTIGSYSMRCFSKSGNDEYQDCLLTAGHSKMEIIQVYKAIDKIIQDVRVQLEGDKLWYAFTMCFNNNGKFKANFDYECHDENTLQYIERWKRTYLL